MTRGSGTKAVDEYLTSVRAHLRAGNATEHTFRPALQQLLEAMATRNATVTNEPRQVACVFGNLFPSALLFAFDAVQGTPQHR